MVVSGSVRWMISAIFAMTGCWHLAATLRAGGVGGTRNAHDCLRALVHLVMAGAMVGMFWVWAGNSQAVLQAVVFASAAVWFALAADRSFDGWYDVVMMAAMVWMAAAMVSLMHPTATLTAASSTESMPPMSMAAATSTTHPATWIGVSALAFCGFFLVTASRYLVRTRRHLQAGRAAVVVNALVHDGLVVLTAIGMCTSCLLMA
jgi:hypothetical protein